MHSPQYSNRRVTRDSSDTIKSQESSHPVDSSATVKSPQLHTVQLEPVTVQQHSRQRVDSLEKSSHPIEIQLHLSQQVYW